MHQGYPVWRGKNELNAGTWHAHFYSKPPARPTPHFVEDILGLRSSSLDIREDSPKKLTVGKQIHKDAKETDLVDIPCVRKSKQRSKCKSRGIKGAITEKNRDATRSKAKTASKTTKEKELQITAKPKPDQILKVENQADAKKKKKARTTFTGRQIWELENTFKEKKYLTSTERNELADLLNVTDCQVKIWFQNRRTKYKKLTTPNAEDSPENGEEPRSAASSNAGSPIASNDSPTTNEVSNDEMSTDNFCKAKGQLFSVKNENNNEETVDVCMEVDDDRGL